MKRKLNPQSAGRNSFQHEGSTIKVNNPQELFNRIAQEYMIQWHNCTEVEIGQLITEATNNNTTVAVTFCPAGKDSQWLHLHIYGSDMHSHNGRLEFGNSKNATPFPLVFILFKDSHVQITGY